MSASEIAWAAGFFDGEGSITVYGRARGDLAVVVSQATRSLSDLSCPEVIARFHAAVGVGRVLGPYRQDLIRRPIFKWLARNQLGVDALSLMWPFLGERKREQARDTYDRWRPGVTELRRLPWSGVSA